MARESRFAQTMKARYPKHFVDCVGVGSTPETDGGQIFAVFERATGISLSSAAHRFHESNGIQHVSQALDVLDQLLTIMMDMMKPDGEGASSREPVESSKPQPCAQRSCAASKYLQHEGNLHFHLDLKPAASSVACSRRAIQLGLACPVLYLAMC